MTNKLDEIDPDGKKCVFVTGHLSAIYHLNDGEWLETMNRVVFHIRNTGEHELYNKKDKLHKYTVYLKQ